MKDKSSQSDKSYFSLLQFEIEDYLGTMARYKSDVKARYAEEIAIYNNNSSEETKKSDQKLKGSHSTKGEEALILCLRCHEPTSMAKILCKHCEAQFEKGSYKIQRVIALDPQTGFYDLHSFSDMVAEEIKRHKHYNHPLSMCIIAFDNAEEVVRLKYWPDYESTRKIMCDTMRECLTDMDIACFRPVAFHLLLPETDAAKARSIVENFMKKLNSKINAPEKDDFTLTGSVGIATSKIS